MNTQTWIKRTNRKPTPADLPIVTTCYHHNKWCTQLWTEWVPGEDHEYTYWQPFQVKPPPCERTQAEKDKFEARLWIAHHFTADECGSWFSALEKLALSAVHAERHEVARMAAEAYGDQNWGRGKHCFPPTVALRARLDEQGGGK